MVYSVLSGENDLGDGNEGVALLKQRLNNGRQGFRGMQGGVVKEDNRTGLNFRSYPLHNFAGGQVLPVQAVTECNKGKFL